MNRLAIWVARTAVGATAPMAPAQATASPLTESEAGPRADPDTAAPPLVAMDVIHRLERRARGALIQRGRSAAASDALTVHPVTAANDSRIHDARNSARRPVQSGKQQSRRGVATELATGGCSFAPTFSAPERPPADQMGDDRGVVADR